MKNKRNAWWKMKAEKKIRLHKDRSAVCWLWACLMFMLWKWARKQAMSLLYERKVHVSLRSIYMGKLLNFPLFLRWPFFWCPSIVLLLLLHLRSNFASPASPSSTNKRHSHWRISFQANRVIVLRQYFLCNFPFEVCTFSILRCVKGIFCVLHLM